MSRRSSFPTGTIFVEGIADLSAQAQLPQLRVLQEIESEPARGAQLIAAANRDLPLTLRTVPFAATSLAGLTESQSRSVPRLTGKRVSSCRPGIFSLATLDEHVRNYRA
jgi:hypothetical protein